MNKCLSKYLNSDSAIFVGEGEDVLVAGSLREPTREDRRVLVKVGRESRALQPVERLLAVHHEALKHVVVVKPAI